MATTPAASSVQRVLHSVYSGTAFRAGKPIAFLEKKFLGF